MAIFSSLLENFRGPASNQNNMNNLKNISSSIFLYSSVCVCEKHARAFPGRSSPIHLSIFHISIHHL